MIRLAITRIKPEPSFCRNLVPFFLKLLTRDFQSATFVASVPSVSPRLVVLIFPCGCQSFPIMPRLFVSVEFIYIFFFCHIQVMLSGFRSFNSVGTGTESAAEFISMIFPAARPTGITLGRASFSEFINGSSVPGFLASSFL